MRDISDFRRNGYRQHAITSAIVMLVIAVWFLAVPVAAHAPTAMRFSFEPSGNLSVTITHPVDDPATHYVNNVQIRLNDKVISDYSYTNQPTKDTFTYTYHITVQAGDEVRVVATCVQGGTLEKSYVPVGNNTQVPTQTLLPARSSMTPSTVLPTTTRAAATELLPLIGIAAALLIRKE